MPQYRLCVETAPRDISIERRLECGVGMWRRIHGWNLRTGTGTGTGTGGRAFPYTAVLYECLVYFWLEWYFRRVYVLVHLHGGTSTNLKYYTGIKLKPKTHFYGRAAPYK